jgi:hypothetical protein
LKLECHLYLRLFEALCTVCQSLEYSLFHWKSRAKCKCCASGAHLGSIVRDSVAIFLVSSRLLCSLFGFHLDFLCVLLLFPTTQRLQTVTVRGSNPRCPHTGLPLDCTQAGPAERPCDGRAQGRAPWRAQFQRAHLRDAWSNNASSPWERPASREAASSASSNLTSRSMWNL